MDDLREILFCLALAVPIWLLGAGLLSVVFWFSDNAWPV